MHMYVYVYIFYKIVPYLKGALFFRNVVYTVTFTRQDSSHTYSYCELYIVKFYNKMFYARRLYEILHRK